MFADTHDGFEPMPLPHPIRSTVKSAALRMAAAAWRSMAAWTTRRDSLRAAAELRALDTWQLRDIGLNRIEIGSLPIGDAGRVESTAGVPTRAAAKGIDHV